MQIERPTYLNRLISHKHNHLIKIITGIRRCGKSFLLFNFFRDHLHQEGVDNEHIIGISLENRKHKELRNPDKCYEYVSSRLKDGEMYYVLLDEVQLMDEFEDVLNGFLHFDNVDVYVTGSNSKFLSSDIITEFRGRGDEIRVHPLSFAEFFNFRKIDWQDAWNEYSTFGGLPYIVQLSLHEEKVQYLQNLFQQTYLRDIIDRNHIRNDTELDELVNMIASAIGSLTNPQKLANTFQSHKNARVSAPTVKQYLDYLRDAFLIEKALRYDVKGKKYINTPSKYYFEDVGLRNARLNFRQQEETHIMENIIFNELRMRGFLVDVGIVPFRERQLGKYVAKQAEIDFIANKGSQRYYIQSAFAIPSEDKQVQEERPLRKVTDSFKKIIIVKDNIMLHRDEYGITTIGLKEFLLNPDSLNL